MHKRFTLCFCVVLPLICLLMLPACPASAQADSSGSQKQARSIQSEIERDQVTLDQVTREYNQYKVDVVNIDKKLVAEQNKLRQAEAQKASVQETMNKRAVYYYKHGSTSFIDALLRSRSFADLLNRAALLSLIFDRDAELISKLKESSESYRAQSKMLAQAHSEKKAWLAKSQGKRIRLQNRLAMQTQRLADVNRSMLNDKRIPVRYKVAMASKVSTTIARTYTARGDSRQRFVFPVNGPNNYINSWGFSRSGGRHHKGVDIMAQHGTPAVACIDGFVERTSRTDRGLGGITLYLRGVDGNRYYYAHLDAIVAGIGPGSRVSAGQLIAFVGSSGNASSGAPHLHFEIQQDGRQAINPYFTLKKAER